MKIHCGVLLFLFNHSHPYITTTLPYVTTIHHTLQQTTTHHHNSPYITTNHHTSPQFTIHYNKPPHITTIHHTLQQTTTHHHNSPYITTIHHTSPQFTIHHPPPININFSILPHSQSICLISQTPIHYTGLRYKRHQAVKTPSNSPLKVSFFITPKD